MAAGGEGDLVDFSGSLDGEAASAEGLWIAGVCWSIWGMGLTSAPFFASGPTLGPVEIPDLRLETAASRPAGPERHRPAQRSLAEPFPAPVIGNPALRNASWGRGEVLSHLAHWAASDLAEGQDQKLGGKGCVAALSLHGWLGGLQLPLQ